MIEAKPVIKDQYWILKDGDKKIGNIQAGPEGYSVRINDTVSIVDNLSRISKLAKIYFEQPAGSSKKNDSKIYGYDPGCRTYNAMYDVRRQLALFTKTKTSKSWFAAGWFRVCQHGIWSIQKNPKLITLQRYQFEGPYREPPK